MLSLGCYKNSWVTDSGVPVQLTVKLLQAFSITNTLLLKCNSFVSSSCFQNNRVFDPAWFTITMYASAQVQQLSYIKLLQDSWTSGSMHGLKFDSTEIFDFETFPRMLSKR
jgi:hypothetical protein